MMPPGSDHRAPLDWLSGWLGVYGLGGPTLALAAPSEAIAAALEARRQDGRPRLRRIISCWCPHGRRYRGAPEAP